MPSIDRFNTVPEPDKPKAKKLTREMLFLAEQAVEGKLKVLPGKQWALHHPVDEETRAKKLQGLLDGKYLADEVAEDIKPDALIYNAEDIESQGLEKVSSRIRDLSAFITHYDYPRFARFVESMRGHDIPLAELDSLYSGITQSRVQKKMMDSYGQTGRRQMSSALRGEAEAAMESIGSLSRSQKVLKALKINWMHEDLGLVTMEERDRVMSELSGDERKLFEGLESSYREYIHKGKEDGYQKLTETVRDGFQRIQKETESGQSSESMQELEQELEEYKEQVKPEDHAGDLATPPDEQDELYTDLPDSPKSEGGAERQKSVFFEITPPLGGYYVGGRKSYYDIDKKTWRKNKQLSAYIESVAGDERHTIHGTTRGGLKSIPIPATYTIDHSSLEYEGEKPKIVRDQYGCFYIQTNGTSSFSVDFLKEESSFVLPPIAEDSGDLYRGKLSQKTEVLLTRLSGKSLQKAEQVRQYILAHHFYPGGGDLEAAKALQLKLLSESTGDTYVQNLDTSEYLECRSANTLGAAICRKANVPVRLVVGDHVEGAKDGKSQIDETTGHAWTEVWDGNSWRRFDFTPNVKPEDKKPKEEEESKESAEDAEDNGVDKPQEKEDGDGEKGEGEKGQKQEGKKGEKGEKDDTAEGEAGDSDNPLDEMSEASDEEAGESESELQEAKEQMDKMSKEKERLEDKAQKADKFKELAELEKEIDKSDLLEDMKQELKDKLEAKEEQMKDTIKEELDKMVEDGFMDEKKRDEILKELEEKELAELDRVQRQIEEQNQLYNDYEDIREEVSPLVEKWFEYFAERLPRQDEIEFDDVSLTREGAFDRKAMMRFRNILFGTIKNPRQFNPSIKPRFMASILVDVSGSMEGPKLTNARKLLIFYSELFSRISEAFGYIRFSIDTFSDNVTPIKGFTQDYDSPQRYDFNDGTQSTVKVRLMQKLKTVGGTNMLDGIQKAARELSEQVEEFPDHASALYFVGDGGDTCGNGPNITRFLQTSDSERGFGEHMYSAILLGNEAQRQELAAIFGDEHTNVAPDFDELIEKSMDKFDEDLEDYLRTKAR